MGPFRSAPEAPPPPSTDELDALIRRKRRNRVVALVAVVVVPLLVVASMFVVPSSLRAWRERKRPLTAAEREAVNRSLAGATAALEKHEASFRAFWPSMIEGTIGPRPELGTCPLDITPPAMRSATSPLDGRHELTLVDDPKAPARFMLVDATSRAVAAGVGTRVPKELASGAWSATTADAPTPTVILQRVRADLDDLRGKAGAPFPMSEHADVVDEAAAYGEGRGYGTELVIVVDAWLPPHVTGAKTFAPGAVAARAFVWQPARDRAICAADIRAESSEGVGYVQEITDTRDKLAEDLVNRFYAALAKDFYGAGPTPAHALAPRAPGAGEPSSE